MIKIRSLILNHSSALACASAVALFGCGAAPTDTGDSEGASVAETTQALSPGWHFVSSDISPSTSYTINGAELDLAFSGYYTWPGTWATGFHGYTFAEPVKLVEGGHYQLTLTVSNASNPIPVVLKAQLSGAGAEQTQTLFGNGSAQLDFTVSSCPGRSPVLDLTAHPALGHIGPLENTGILIQSYSVTASLVRVP